MAIIEHDLFTTPEQENLAVFRYMDFLKYISLIRDKKLYCTRAMKLLEIDPW